MCLTCKVSCWEFFREQRHETRQRSRVGSAMWRSIQSRQLKRIVWAPQTALEKTGRASVKAAPDSDAEASADARHASRRRSPQQPSTDSAA